MAPSYRNTTAEKVLLGACLTAPAHIDTALARGIQTDDFTDPVHVSIWEALTQLRDLGEDIEEIGVMYQMRSADKTLGDQDQVRLLQILNELSDQAINLGSIEKTAKLVKEASLRRAVQRLQLEITEKVTDESTPFADTVGFLRKKLEDISSETATSKLPPLRGISTIAIPKNDDPTCLLGTRRWVCRGAQMIWAAPSGIGKSSLTLQAAITWAVGKPFFGIHPVRGHQTSLYIQAEDDDGDIGEIFQGVCEGLGLGEEEQKNLAKKVVIIEDRIHTGMNFIQAIPHYIKEFEKQTGAPPDHVWINPLLAYLGTDVSDQKEVSAFLRDGLNRINADKQFAWHVVHHDNKPPTGKDRGKRGWNEYAYAMSGSAELTNWARGVVAIIPRPDHKGEFVFKLAKRGDRAGVTDEYGNIIFDIPIRWSRDKIFWELSPMTGDVVNPETGSLPDSRGRDPQFKDEDILMEFPTVANGKNIPLGTAAKNAADRIGISRSSFTRRANDLVARGLLVRDGKNWFLTESGAPLVEAYREDSKKRMRRASR